MTYTYATDTRVWAGEYMKMARACQENKAGQYFLDKTQFVYEYARLPRYAQAAVAVKEPQG
jgi:hypothetical protein